MEEVFGLARRFQRFFGLSTTFWLFILVEWSALGIYDPSFQVPVPLSEQLLIVFSFTGCLMGLLGAWVVVKHGKVGSFALLIGGLLPVVSSLIPGPSYSQFFLFL